MALAKCEHPGCSCLPAPGSDFCSDHCEEVFDHKLPDDTGCGCGHAGCDPRALSPDNADHHMEDRA